MNYQGIRLKRELERQNRNHEHHQQLDFPRSAYASQANNDWYGNGACNNSNTMASWISDQQRQRHQQRQQLGSPTPEYASQATNHGCGSEASSNSNTTASWINDQQKQQDEQINILPHHREYLGFTTYGNLTTYGVCVIDNFLKGNLARQLFTLVESLSSSHGLLHDPMMSLSNARSQSFTRYRDDYITWLSGSENGYPCIETLKSCLNTIIKLFYRYSLSQNEKYCITHRSSVQVSCFPADSMGYKLHSDNPNNNGRLLTLVYHCNAGYEKHTSGGCSRFYTNNKKYIDIEPKFNRLVIYWSSNYLEVQPCKSSLYSLTTWYNGTKIKEPVANNFPNTSSPFTIQSSLNLPSTSSSTAILNNEVDAKMDEFL